MKVICIVCEKEFVSHRGKGRNEDKCCSRECRVKSRDNIKRCPTCGKEFRTTVANIKKYCSKECVVYSGRKSDISKKSVFICIWCKKEFTEWTYRKPTLCSNQCRSEYGGSVRGKQLYKPDSVIGRGMNWKKQAKLARIRDEYTCQVCGKDGWTDKFKVQVHHIIPYRLFNGDYEKANNLDNLISLCPSCHPKVESGKVKLPNR